jgi:hypothetical protein
LFDNKAVICWLKLASFSVYHIFHAVAHIQTIRVVSHGTNTATLSSFALIDKVLSELFRIYCSVKSHGVYQVKSPLNRSSFFVSGVHHVFKLQTLFIFPITQCLGISPIQSIQESFSLQFGLIPLVTAFVIKDCLYSFKSSMDFS